MTPADTVLRADAPRSPAVARWRVPPQLRGWTAGWMLLVALIVAEEVWSSRWNGPPYRWRTVLVIQAVQWGVWTLLLPGVLLLVDRITAQPRSASASTAALVGLGAAVSLLHAVVFSAVMPTLYYGPSLAAFQDVLRYRGAAILPVNAVVFVAAVGAVRAYRWSELAREGAVARARLEAEAERARADALAGQLEPHFLFNALGGIVALISVDPKRAEGMAYALSELLRRTLAGLRGAESTLGEEIEYGRRYLALQAMRFEGLAFELRAAPEVLGTPVPALFLQPILENAVTHGVARRGGEGRVAVTAEAMDGEVRIDVTDSGGAAGRDDPPRPGTGIGMENVRRRLELFYGRPARLDVARGAAGETSVRLALPAAARGPGR